MAALVVNTRTTAPILIKLKNAENRCNVGEPMEQKKKEQEEEDEEEKERANCFGRMRRFSSLPHAGS